MAESSRPWSGTSPGDAGPYSSQQWQKLYQAIIGLGGSRANVGPFLGSGSQPNDGLRVQAQGPATTSIDVLAGAALVQGAAYLNTATVSFAIAANSSGNPRIDTVILRADYALQTIRLAVLQGTPAATPSPASLTQTLNVLWEIPLADIAVANGFSSITQANITPRHEWVNAPPGVYLDNVVNNSGGTLQDGDVVIWDTSADRAVTTTTTANDSLLAGVWRGRTANGSYGRVQVQGIGYVNANAAITRGATLTTSGTAKQAAANASISLIPILGTALETTSGAGFVLAHIRVSIRAISVVGWQPYAWPITQGPVSTATSANITLAANGGSCAIPIYVSSHMLLQSVSVEDRDSTLARTWGWDLYFQDTNTGSGSENTLSRVANSSADETFTAAAISTRTIDAANAPVYLRPGLYWLVIQCRHASNAFNLGGWTTSEIFNTTNGTQTKTTTNPNGASLDFVAATWTKAGTPAAVRLNGRVFGQTAAF